MAYVVAIDPTAARSVVAEYSSLAEAQARVDRELAHRLNGRGGSVTLSFPVGEQGRSVDVWRVNPADYAGQCHQGFATDSLLTADAPYVCGHCGGDRRLVVR